MRLHKDFIQKTISDISFLYENFPQAISFSIDSRSLQSGELFVAIKGNLVDGHDFIEEALQKNAAGILMAHDQKDRLKKIDQALVKNKCIMLVADPRQAVIDMARTWRKQFAYPVIGVTGSVGKTTTKEMIGVLLQEHGMRALISQGNQNTLLGASLNILRMTSDHDIAVFELGIGRRGQMAQLAELVQPTAGVITFIGHSHMEGLGSINDIAIEKRDLFKFFKEDSIGIINGDQPLLAQVAYKHPVIKFGTKTTNQVQARKVNNDSAGVSFILKLYGNKYAIRLEKNHSGAVFNALATAAVGYYLQIPAETIIKAIEKPLVVQGRFVQHPLKFGVGKLIDDSYNANPESMKAALLAFEQIKTKAQKIAVIGDMLELGANSPFWHRQIGRFLRKTPSVSTIILVGSLVEWTKKTLPLGTRVEHVPTWKEAQEKLQEELKKESMVLVKGSLGMQLKNLVDALT
ncbi:MAG: UDP-N-acetylmuramoyl-tripeptide--D-alanyl-D-alanine ligase [Candidatus Babeliales bacterium]